MTVLILASPAASLPPTSFTDDDAMDLFGHTFKEEFWTAEDVPFTTAGGAEVSFATSYAQYKSVDTFLVAFNTHEKAGNVSTLPYQLFGLHYYTPTGQEVLIGAMLAFLMAFNDTMNGNVSGQNGLPDPGHEDVYYIIPFGIGGVLTEEEYVPEVEPIDVQKLGKGHFRFGQRYTNLYAKVIGANNPIEILLSTLFPLYIAKFSELTVEYEVRIDEEAGTVTAETFYTIGEVTKLWIAGKETDPHAFPDNWGMCAVHYVVVFATNFVFSKETAPNVDIETGITETMDEDIDIRVGNGRERAFTIGHRGKYDLVDESTGTKIRENEDAVALTLQSTGADAILLAWQAAFSLDVFCTASWAISDSLQNLYASPRALFNLAGATFTAAPLWYATSFPGWNGYRVVHDPTYTGYANVAFETEPPEKKSPGFEALFVLAAIAIPTVVHVLGRKRR
jgi:hypothetical protein